MTDTIITFQCRECGVVIKIWIRKNFKLIFNILGNNIATERSLTKHGYFKCVNCNTIDNTKRFERVFS